MKKKENGGKFDIYCCFENKAQQNEIKSPAN